VDTYVIRRSVQQASSIGIDLLSALKLTFGATLYDFDKTTTQNDNVSATQWTTTSAADLTIPSITYALSIANDSSVYTSLEASPSVLLNLNEKSKIFEGTEVFIVSTSSQTSGQFEKEIGVSLEATANSFTENEANLTLDVNLSTVNTTASTSNFETLNTDKLESEVTGIFPYDKAVVVSAFSSLNLRTNDTGQTGLKDVPGAGRLFGVDSASATARDVLVVSIVRLVSGVQRAPQSIEKNLADSLGIEVPEEDFSRVGFVYDLPSTRILMNIFNDQVVELLRKHEMPEHRN
jgi:type II secretory pathway component GspD/PulD (secretin)